MLASDPLPVAMRLLHPRIPRLLLAIALGVLSLGSALTLAGLSAWLITRAWQMPPVLDLSIAVVAVRTFAISRGVLHYCERLAGHDTALRAAGTARAQLYYRLAHGPADIATRLHRGGLVSPAHPVSVQCRGGARRGGDRGRRGYLTVGCGGLGDLPLHRRNRRALAGIER